MDDYDAAPRMTVIVLMIVSSIMSFIGFMGLFKSNPMFSYLLLGVSLASMVVVVQTMLWGNRVV